MLSKRNLHVSGWMLVRVVKGSRTSGTYRRRIVMEGMSTRTDRRDMRK